MREFSTTKPAPEQMLNDLLYTANREKVYKLEPKTIKEMATGSYLSIIILNINGLNVSTKDKDWLNG